MVQEQRKYSVSEIDRMRRAIRDSYPRGVSYTASERSVDTEEQLRTYMLNGTDPEELEENCRSIYAKDIEAMIYHSRAVNIF